MQVYFTDRLTDVAESTFRNETNIVRALCVAGSSRRKTDSVTLSVTPAYNTVAVKTPCIHTAQRGHIVSGPPCRRCRRTRPNNFRKGNLEADDSRDNVPCTLNTAPREPASCVASRPEKYVTLNYR